MKLHKKAQTDMMLNWAMWRIPILVIVVGTLFVILASPFNSGLNTRDIENYILIKRLTYSPNFLAYQDPVTNRVYPGIIDISKFDTEKIEASIINKNKMLAVNMELSDIDTNTTARAYINEEKARAWDDYVAIGGYDASTIKRYVKIFTGKEFHQGLLKIKVLIKK